MINIRRLSIGFAVIGLFALVFAALTTEPSAEAAVTVFETQLVGAQENPPVTNSTGTAFARFTFDDQTRALTYTITVSGLSPDQVTAAHIHRGAVGVNGPIVHFFSDKGFTVVSGTINLSEADVADLRAGNFYANVHSIQHPGGFARGQMFLAPDNEVKATFDRAVAAWNAKNTPAFLANFTDAGVMSSFEGTRAEALEFLPEFLGTVPLSFRNFKVVSSTTNEATVEAELILGQAVDSFARFQVVREGTTWKINNEQDSSPAIPSGVTTVSLDLKEYSFVYDKALAAKGNIAFKVQNVGKQPHEVVLAKIPANLNLAQAVMSEDEGPPPGVEDVLQSFYEPGDVWNIVLTSPLAPGRYALVCFVPDNETGPPHAVLGMYSDFTVGSSSGGVTPPSTGDAGLLDSTTTRYAPGATILALGLFGFAFAAMARRRA